jgi:hypothetical protein
MYIVAQKIKQCRVHLLQWSKTQLRFTLQLIESKKARLVQLENSSNVDYDNSEVNVLRHELNVMIEKEEIF